VISTLNALFLIVVDSMFKEFADARGLICRDEFECSQGGYTYHHDTLGQQSWLDHPFVSSSLKNNIA